MQKLFAVFVLVIVVALAAACGGGDKAATTGGGAAGNASAGETLFKQALVGQNPGCATCHSVDGSQLVGPSLKGVAERAASRVQGESAAEYLHQSLVEPNAYVVEGFSEGIMPSYKGLSEAQLNDLVAYLLTLK
ncbi:MAG: Cytochrome c2 precursor [Chloroflexi bacterium ADurb.Bin325]|nr:MAG: Cytochrome c2 precursor [Chloroflexi bacterium ADurb.Bin325]